MVPLPGRSRGIASRQMANLGVPCAVYTARHDSGTLLSHRPDAQQIKASYYAEQRAVSQEAHDALMSIGTLAWERST
jgi:hypothetical protein